MKIGILGWGSLIWNPRNLRTDGIWRPDGPTLPIEFSGVSSNGHLTLVIDEVYGVLVHTQRTVSRLKSLEKAIEDLRRREGRLVKTEQIGFLTKRDEQRSSSGQETHRCRVESILPELRSWLNRSDCDAVIWTDLEPNFEERTKKPFSVENAVAYLRNLNGAAREKAEEYLRKAPSQTETGVRQKARSVLGWTNL